MKHINDTLEGQTILITGGAGFIGSNLAHYLNRHHNARVVVFDKFRSTEDSLTLGHYRNILGFDGEVIAGDITNPKDFEFLKQLPIDYIFHQAAISTTTCENQEIMMRTNVNAFLDILTLAKDKGASVVYASSAAVYGHSPAPNSVGDGEIPENIYGFSKLSMDKVAMCFARDNPNMRIIGLRYFNVYGHGEFHKGKNASMILQMLIQATLNGKVRLFANGDQKRDFVYIDDVIQANIKALKSQRSAIYNIGYGESRSFNEIVKLLKEYLGIRFKVKYIDNPYTFFQEHTCADISSAKMDLEYIPQYGLEDGISAYKDSLLQIRKSLS